MEDKEKVKSLEKVKRLEKEAADFKTACKPLMDYLAKHHHPHTRVIIDLNSAELLEGKHVINLDNDLQEG